METILLEPRKALNKAFLKIKPNRSSIEAFKNNLIDVLDAIDVKETEEFHKNLVISFLKKTYYDPNYFINTKERNDLVIHNGKDAKSSVGVIIEAKSPSNKSEMISKEKLNCKALQELVLYYLRERITKKNTELKYLIVTNIYEWFIFDAHLFNKLFAENKTFVKQFNDFEAKRSSGNKTDYFYKEIAAPYITSLAATIEYTYFDIHNYEKPLRNADKKDDNKLISLYKLLSPEHLLKLSFANDSNTLDKNFYTELLHILGLTETKEAGKKIIERNKPQQRNNGSIIENTIIQLDSMDNLSRLKNPKQYGSTHEERLFGVALELTITWVNRILFLKLLEAQLISYHSGDSSYSFLSIDKIKDYDNLNTLFFQVLAKKMESRNSDVQQLFAKVPYLNSSLFEMTDLEHDMFPISQLEDNKTLPLLNSTVIKDTAGKKSTGSLNTLQYFFAFLDAYDFASEGSEEIQEDNKTLINASVLGLIFEKINGYKDGSFFTPGLITMYMCRETIRKAVIQKFNEIKGWDCQSFIDLQNMKFGIREANDIINSIKICDPAVGSGHFLVSALNEIISVFVSQYGVDTSFSNSDSWTILSPIEQRIKAKIEVVGTPLRDWDININYGIKTGCNDAFIIDGAKKDELIAQDPKSAEIIRPILRGRDIKRYSYEYADLYIIATFPSLKIDIETYPAVKQHLLAFGYDRLKQTGEPGARKKTNNKWFETQDSISYWEDFYKQKIVWGNLNLKASYSFVEGGVFVNAPCPLIVPASGYLLAILNSKLADYYIRSLGVTRNGGYFEYKPMFVEQLPVPNISQLEKERFEELIENIQQNNNSTDEQIMQKYIYELYGLEKEEIEFIESL